MNDAPQNDMIALIDMFIENELLFSEYYSECARLFADRADNFEKLQSETL